ncbi:hypothetical protein MBLNU459_g1606t1 [Dothideomycetes sp. NU459]
MAISEFVVNDWSVLARITPIVIASSVLGTLVAFYLYARDTTFSATAGAPKLVKGDWPLVGSLGFFSRRFDFHQQAARQSPTGQFTFHAGQYPVVGLSGEEGRRVFFETKALDLVEGYAALLGGSPKTTEDGSLISKSIEDRDDSAHFARRLAAMLKKENFVRGLPNLIADVRSRLDALVADPEGITEPFDSIYKIVYQLTMRTVACNEIAGDPVMLQRTLSIFEAVEQSSTAAVIMFPRLPTLGMIKRFWGGAQLYRIFKNIVDDRTSHNRRENDPLQFLMDQGDSITSIVKFVLGALFAGQLNSGINAAAVITYLANDRYWREKARAEVESVVARYDADTSRPLRERLSSIPLEAWESEFHLLDLCLRESIRLQFGTAFRRNNTDKPVMIGKEQIPPGAYATYTIGDIHLNPEVYSEPFKFDPGRFLPDRAEDKKTVHGFLGWGVSRHPCLGIRFAKLEQNIIIAYFLAYFDFELCNEKAETGVPPPQPDLNSHTAVKPKTPVYVKYTVREKN